MVVKPEQERVRTLLSDTITLLCRNGLTYKSKFCISALVGITIDEDEVFLVDIRETIKNNEAEDAESNPSESEAVASPKSPSAKRRKRRKRSRASVSSNEQGDNGASRTDDEESSDLPAKKNKEIKQELDEDDDSQDLVFIKDEPGVSDMSSMNSSYQGHSQSYSQPQPQGDILTNLAQQGQLFATPSSDQLQGVPPGGSWDPSSGQQTFAAHPPSTSGAMQGSSSQKKKLVKAPVLIIDEEILCELSASARDTSKDTTNDTAAATTGEEEDLSRPKCVSCNTRACGDDLRCSVCGHHVYHRQSLRRHMRQAHRDRMKRCAKCNAVFYDMQTLRNHMVARHGKKIKSQAVIDQETELQKASAPETPSKSKTAQLPESPSKAASYSGAVVCKGCLKPFSTNKTLRAHQSLGRCLGKATPTKTQQPAAAAESAAAESSLNESMESSHEQGTPLCNGCGRTFSSRKTLQVHLKLKRCLGNAAPKVAGGLTSGGRKKLKCKFCSKVVSGMPYLVQHVRAFHKKQLNADKATKAAPSKVVSTKVHSIKTAMARCPHCKKIMLRNSLYKHINNQHPDKGKVSLTDIGALPANGKPASASASSSKAMPALGKLKLNFKTPKSTKSVKNDKEEIDETNMTEEEMMSKDGTKCNVCGKTFTLKKNLKRHLKLAHLNKRASHASAAKENAAENEEDDDSDDSNDKESDEVEKSDEDGAENEGSDNDDDQEEGEVAARETVANNTMQAGGGGIFACTQCDKTFTCDNSLKRHIKVKHDKKGCKKCHLCPAEFWDNRSLGKHLVSKHDLKIENLKCDECPQRFPTPASLRVHKMAEHGLEISTTCYACGADFSSPADLIQHLKQAHLVPPTPTGTDNNDDENAEDSDLDDLDVSASSLRCPECDMEFVAVDTLRDHMSSVHGDDVYDDSPDGEEISTVVKCTRCDKIFERDDAWQEHLLSEHDVPEAESEAAVRLVIRCRDCDELFDTPASLREHRSEEHKETRENGDDATGEGDSGEEDAEQNEQEKEESEEMEQNDNDADEEEEMEVSEKEMEQNEVDENDEEAMEENEEKIKENEKKDDEAEGDDDL